MRNWFQLTKICSSRASAVFIFLLVVCGLFYFCYDNIDNVSRFNLSPGCFAPWFIKFSRDEQAGHDDYIVEKIYQQESEGRDMRSKETLELHFEFLSKLSRGHVESNGRKFSLNDLCYKPHHHSMKINESQPIYMQRAVLEARRLAPCLFNSPANCFYESYREHSKISRWRFEVEHLNKRLRDSFPHENASEMKEYVTGDDALTLLEKWSKLMSERAETDGFMTKEDSDRWQIRIYEWLESMRSSASMRWCLDPLRTCDDPIMPDAKNYYNVCQAITTFNDYGHKFHRKLFLDVPDSDEELTTDMDCDVDKRKFIHWVDANGGDDLLMTLANGNRPELPDIKKTLSGRCSGIFGKNIEFFDQRRLMDSSSSRKDDKAMDILYLELVIMKPEQLLENLHDRARIEGVDADQYTLEMARNIIKKWRTVIREEVKSFGGMTSNNHKVLSKFVTSIDADGTISHTKLAIWWTAGSIVGLLTLHVIFFWSDNSLYFLTSFFVRFYICTVFFKTFSAEDDGYMQIDMRIFWICVLIVFLNILVTSLLMRYNKRHLADRTTIAKQHMRRHLEKTVTCYRTVKDDLKRRNGIVQKIDEMIDNEYKFVEVIYHEESEDVGRISVDFLVFAGATFLSIFLGRCYGIAVFEIIVAISPLFLCYSLELSFYRLAVRRWKREMHDIWKGMLDEVRCATEKKTIPMDGELLKKGEAIELIETKLARRIGDVVSLSSKGSRPMSRATANGSTFLKLLTLPHDAALYASLMLYLNVLTCRRIWSTLILVTSLFFVISSFAFLLSLYLSEPSIRSGYNENDLAKLHDDISFDVTVDNFRNDTFQLQRKMDNLYRDIRYITSITPVSYWQNDFYTYLRDVEYRLNDEIVRGRIDVQTCRANDTVTVGVRKACHLLCVIEKTCFNTGTSFFHRDLVHSRLFAGAMSLWHSEDDVASTIATASLRPSFEWDQSSTSHYENPKQLSYRLRFEFRHVIADDVIDTVEKVQDIVQRYKHDMTVIPHGEIYSQYKENITFWSLFARRELWTSILLWCGLLLISSFVFSPKLAPFFSTFVVATKLEVAVVVWTTSDVTDTNLVYISIVAFVLCVFSAWLPISALSRYRRSLITSSGVTSSSTARTALSEKCDSVVVVEGQGNTRKEQKLPFHDYSAIARVYLVVFIGTVPLFIVSFFLPALFRRTVVLIMSTVVSSAVNALIVLPNTFQMMDQTLREGVRKEVRASDTLQRVNRIKTNALREMLARSTESLGSKSSSHIMIPTSNQVVVVEVPKFWSQPPVKPSGPTEEKHEEEEEEVEDNEDEEPFHSDEEYFGDDTEGEEEDVSLEDEDEEIMETVRRLEERWAAQSAERQAEEERVERETFLNNVQNAEQMYRRLHEHKKDRHQRKIEYLEAIKDFKPIWLRTEDETGEGPSTSAAESTSMELPSAASASSSAVPLASTSTPSMTSTTRSAQAPSTSSAAASTSVRTNTDGSSSSEPGSSSSTAAQYDAEYVDDEEDEEPHPEAFRFPPSFTRQMIEFILDPVNRGDEPWVDFTVPRGEVPAEEGPPAQPEQREEANQGNQESEEEAEEEEEEEDAEEEEEEETSEDEGFEDA